MVFAFKSKEDILLKNEIENFKKTLDLNIMYFAENLSEEDEKNLNYQKGLINSDKLNMFLPKDKSENHLILICGSKAFSGMFIKPILIDYLHYSNKQIVIF